MFEHCKLMFEHSKLMFEHSKLMFEHCKLSVALHIVPLSCFCLVLSLIIFKGEETTEQ